MGLLDFLNDGKAVTVPYSALSQSALPDWYTNYAMQILSNQQAVANTPYATFQGPRVAGFNGDDASAFSLTRDASTGYQGTLGAAGAAINGINPGGALTAATPYLERAGGKFPDHVSEYMNPYNDLVVNRIGELGTRNLMENILPGINDQFIGAGSFGGTRQAEISGRAVRDAVAEIAAQQGQALAQGYGQAADIYGADASRAGNTGGQFASIIGQGDNLALGKAGALGSLAAQTQQQGLAGAGALSAIGGQQRGMVQQNYDTAYADFLRQQGWPQEQIDAMTKTLGGVAPAVPKAMSEAGTKPTNEFSPSTLSTIGSLASLAKGVGIF